MDKLGADSYFLVIAAVMGVIALYGFYRTARHPFAPREDRHEFSIYAPSTAGANLRLHDRALDQKMGRDIKETPLDC